MVEHIDRWNLSPRWHCGTGIQAPDCQPLNFSEWEKNWHLSQCYLCALESNLNQYMFLQGTGNW